MEPPGRSPQSVLDGMGFFLAVRSLAERDHDGGDVLANRTQRSPAVTLPFGIGGKESHARRERRALDADPGFDLLFTGTVDGDGATARQRDAARPSGGGGVLPNGLEELVYGDLASDSLASSRFRIARTAVWTFSSMPFLP